MPRVKRGILHAKRRKNLLKKTKGFKGGLKNRIKLAKVAAIKAGVNAYEHRRTKKRTNRSLWLIRLNAAARMHDLSYSKFISLIKKANIGLDRKVLSEIAYKNPEIFAKIVEKIK